jgi:hypothetical protein
MLGVTVAAVTVSPPELDEQEPLLLHTRKWSVSFTPPGLTDTVRLVLPLIDGALFVVVQLLLLPIHWT